MELESYVKKFRPWFESLLTSKAVSLHATRRCCVNITPTKISIVELDTSHDELNCLFAHNTTYNNVSELTNILNAAVQKHELSNVPCYWLLHPDDYQIFLIESLPVPDAELANALNWRVRSLLSYPADEAIIEYFSLPEKKSSPGKPMVAAITANRSQLAIAFNAFKKSGCYLTRIDIPELALRNLTSQYENDEKSTAFIYFFKQTAIFNISRQKILYFSRRLNWSSKTAPSIRDYEQIGLEILRYFDFFQSHWRYPTPLRIFVASEQENTEDIARLLSETLFSSVTPYTFPPKSGLNKNEQTMDKNNLLALGGALYAGR